MSLVDEVRKIDEDAADFLQFETPEYPIDRFFCPLAETIDGAFVWGDSPQGHNYWERIAHALRTPTYTYTAGCKCGCNNLK